MGKFFETISEIYIHFVVRILWRLNGIRISAIRNFQATEADGVWHLLRGIRRCKNSWNRAQLFQHILEEDSHADEFGALYRREAKALFVPRHYDRRDLYPSDTPEWKLMAYIHVGEVDATKRFSTIISATRNESVKAVLSKVLCDEAGHQDLTRSMLVRMGASDKEAIEEEINSITGMRRYQSIASLAVSASNVVYGFILSSIYYFFGALFTRTARKKMKKSFVTHDNSFIKRAFP